MSTKKATLSTVPVAWHDGAPIKYQSTLSYPITKERTIRILSSPEPTEELALDDLYNELNLWRAAVKAFDDLINKE